MIETYQTSNVLRDIYLLYSLNLNLGRFVWGGRGFRVPLQ